MQKSKSFKIIINIIVNIIFSSLFAVIYQAVIFNNLDVFGVTITGGGWIPYGFKVRALFFRWAVLSRIIAVTLWLIKKFGKMQNRSD